VTFGDWIFFGLTALALIVLRRKEPAAPRPYRAWGYPVTAWLFFLIAAAVVANVVISLPGPSLVGTAIILAGLPIYALARRKGSPMSDDPAA
jgi:APA family basic amino acid/polyamine antiporter